MVLTQIAYNVCVHKILNHLPSPGSSRGKKRWGLDIWGESSLEGMKNQIIIKYIPFLLSQMERGVPGCGKVKLSPGMEARNKRESGGKNIKAELIESP